MLLPHLKKSLLERTDSTVRDKQNEVPFHSAYNLNLTTTRWKPAYLDNKPLWVSFRIWEALFLNTGRHRSVWWPLLTSSHSALSLPLTVCTFILRNLVTYINGNQVSVIFCPDYINQLPCYVTVKKSQSYMEEVNCNQVTQLHVTKTRSPESWFWPLT